MKLDLSEAIAEVDDPETVQKLMAAVADGEATNTVNNAQTEAHELSELFNRYYNRRQDRSPGTLSQYKRTIPHFLAFARGRDTTHISGVTTGLIDEYVNHLFDEYDRDATILTYTKNVRAWLQWLAKRGLCEDALFHLLDKDELGLSPTARDEALPVARAEHILKRLRNRRYGSFTHALIELLWTGGPRIGGVHSLDRCDFTPAESDLRFRHRPETGTRLKNGDKDGANNGERNIELPQATVDAIEAHLDRQSVITDERGREPLFATSHGRASRSTLRRRVYEATSCRWAPVDEDGQTCDGDCDPDSSVCSYSYYPHAIRRGAIVDHLSGGLRLDYASGRFDVSIEVLKKHYDPRTEKQRKENRAEDVRDAWSQ